MLMSDVEDLYSTEEEPDTMMFLHAFYAASNGITAPTLKFLNATIKRPSLPAFYPSCATCTRSYLDIPQLCDKPNSAVCHAFPSIHAMTSCDTVSCFVGQGKKVLNVIKNGCKGCSATPR